MLVVTTENVPGYRVKDVKGQVFGIVVRSRGLGGNIMAGLRSLAGGEITEYTQLLEEARRPHAGQRHHHDALRLRGDRADDERDRGIRHRGGAREGERLMLRAIVLGIGGIAIAAGALLVAAGTRGPGLNLILIGVVVILG